MDVNLNLCAHGQRGQAELKSVWAQRSRFSFFCLSRSMERRRRCDGDVQICRRRVCFCSLLLAKQNFPPFLSFFFFFRQANLFCVSVGRHLELKKTNLAWANVKDRANKRRAVAPPIFAKCNFENICLPLFEEEAPAVVCWGCLSEIPKCVFYFFFPTRGRKDFRSLLKACMQWVHLALDTNKAVQHVTFVSLNFQSFGGRHPESDEIFRGCNNAAGWLAARCDPPWKTVRKALGLGRVNDFCNIIITKVSGSHGSSSLSWLGI